MLMVRLIHYLSFQPHLAVIGGALARALPMLCYWGLVALIVVLMWIVLLTVAFGYRLGELSSFSATAYSLMKYIIVINRNDGSRATLTEVRPRYRRTAAPRARLAAVPPNPPRALHHPCHVMRAPPHRQPCTAAGSAPPSPPAPPPWHTRSRS